MARTAKGKPFNWLVANAAFIVQAVNSHDELVAALKAAALYLGELESDDEAWSIYSRAINAISRATKQEG